MKLPSGLAGTMVARNQGLILGCAVGQADLTDELRARRCSWPPLRLAPGVLRARIRLCRVSRRAPAQLRGKDGGCARYRTGCAPRFLRDRDCGEGSDPLGRTDSDESANDRGARPES